MKGETRLSFYDLWESLGGLIFNWLLKFIGKRQELQIALIFERI